MEDSRSGRLLPGGVAGLALAGGGKLM